MKIYVVFEDYGWDNVSKPLLVTRSKMQAKMYCKKNRQCSFVEMKLQDGLDLENQ